MRHTNTHIPARAKKVLSAWTVACMVLALVRGPSAMVQTAEAASSFRPTIFVNTEAFLIIDDDDTSSDVVMRFGDTLAKTLRFNRSLDRFEFNDDVYASGGLSASGTLVTESGAYIDGTSLVVQAASNNVGIGTATPLADLHVVGTETRLDTGTTNGTTSLSFVDNNDEKAHFLLNQATATFDIQSDGRIDIGSSDYVNVSGTNYTNIQGSTTFTGNKVGIGTTSPKTRLDVVGAISGSFVYATKSFSGAGLSDCDSGTSKLLWDATTGRFSCGTDQGTTYTAGQGLSLNGSSFRLNTTVTGSVIQAGTTLASSGALTWKGAGSGKSIAVMQDSYFLGNVGVGTAITTHAKLEVVGMASGSVLYAERQLSTSGSATLGEDAGDNVVFNADVNSNITPNTNNSFDFGSSSARWANGWFNNANLSANISVLGTSSLTGNVGIGSANTTTKATLNVSGVMSGVTVYATRSFSGAGLTSCSNATTSKLLWDATTGRFSCGTDQSGAGGLSLSDADARYVNVAGDTMTGVLAVQNGNTHSATTTPLLNIRGTMSGRLLNISGSGASPLLTTTAVKPTVRIGGSGSLVIEARSTDPGSAPENTASLFTQKVGGRAMLHQGSGSTFAASPLQNALFGNLIMSITTGAGTTVNGYGTTVTNDTTVSHPATDQTFGYMTNFATSTTANDEAGTSSANTAFFRGSAAGANGFFYYARVGVVDTTSITVFSGMADQTIATMVGADNPAGNHVGFQFSTGRGDTNWMFTTKDNTTQNANSTGLAFTANKVYDLMFTCTKQCASITWEIRNVTDGTSAKGTTSTNLPAAGTAMRMVLGVETETTAARNIRMQQLYVEVDR